MIFLVCSIFISCAFLYAADPIKNVQTKYGTYTNTRFQFKVIYPKELLIPGEPYENNDGLGFESKDKEIKMTVWGGYNSLMETLQEMAMRYVEDGDTVTYKLLKNSIAVISGKRGDKIYYLKVLLFKDEKDSEDTGTFICFLIEYPEKSKSVWDKITGKCADSLKRDVKSIEAGLDHILN